MEDELNFDINEPETVKMQDAKVMAYCACKAIVKLSENNFDCTEYADGHYEVEISFTCESCGVRTDIVIPK